MQVDTLYLGHEELSKLYYDGAAHLPGDVQSTLRLFLQTVEEVENRYNRVIQQAIGGIGPTGPDDVLEKTHKARIHIHFTVEPA